MTFSESGIKHVTDLRFDLNITESYNVITKKEEKSKYFDMGRSHTCRTVPQNPKQIIAPF